MSHEGQGSPPPAPPVPAVLALVDPVGPVDAWLVPEPLFELDVAPPEPPPPSAGSVSSEHARSEATKSPAEPSHRRDPCMA
jgi:hypothetical protein